MQRTRLLILCAHVATFVASDGQDDLTFWLLRHTWKDTTVSIDWFFVVTLYEIHLYKYWYTSCHYLLNSFSSSEFCFFLPPEPILIIKKSHSKSSSLCQSSSGLGRKRKWVFSHLLRTSADVESFKTRFNIFTTNFRWQIVISFKLGPLLISIFYSSIIPCHL